MTVDFIVSGSIMIAAFIAVWFYGLVNKNNVWYKEGRQFALDGNTRDKIFNRTAHMTQKEKEIFTQGYDDAMFEKLKIV